MSTAAASRVAPSVCPLDCPDTCSLSVTVSEGRITAVRGSGANPYTAGVVCDKVARHYPAFVHGPARLRQPLRRVGAKGEGRFEPIGWAEAIDLVHDGLSRAIDAHGPQSVLPLNYAGPHGQISAASMDRRFFHRLGATLLDRGPLCGVVRGVAYSSLFGAAPGMPPEQLVDSDVIAVWGNNVTVSNLHLTRVIQAARRQGATLIVIDPKRTKIAEQAHLYLQIRPGTDVVLALALAAELERRGAIDRAFVDTWASGFDAYMAHARQHTVAQALAVCGIGQAAFDELARLYAGARRLGLSAGNGMERARNGGSSLRAIMALNVLTGQLGRPGAGVHVRPGLAFPTTAARLQRPDFVPPGTRTVNIVDVGRLLLDRSLDPPIDAVFIYNHNPVATHPDQNRMRRALSREDLFVVGCDVVMTDSLAYSDVILPASSHFEFDDVYTAYGQSYLQRAAPVIPPVGESLPNTEIFRRLAARFGFDDPAFRDSDEALMDAALDADDPRLQGFRPSQLPLDRALLMNTREGEPVRLCDTVKPAHPSGRITLFSEDLETRFGCGLPRHEAVPADAPFVLISPSSARRTNATFGSDPASDGPARVEVHPADAARLGIADGARVRLWNRLGEVIGRARLTDAVPPGVLYSAKGMWLRTSETGQTVNALIDADRRADIMGGACYNDTFVNLAAA